MLRLLKLLLLFLPAACVSYYEGYENDYYASNYSSYYNSPLRVRGLQYNDFYMMDHHSSDYFNMQMWSAISDVSRFSIVSISRNFMR